MPKKFHQQALEGQTEVQPALTLADVAKRAGVSPITVSRTLSRPELVKPRTRERVLDAIHISGYRPPNMMVNGVDLNKTRLISLILPTISNAIFADLVQTIMQRLAEVGYQTQLGLTGYCSEQEESLLNALLRRRPDGIILIGTLHTPSSRKRLSLAGIPVLEAWDLNDDPIDMLIGFSHYSVGQAVADYLLAKGYQRFAAVTVDDVRGLQRCAGLLDRLAQQDKTDIPVEVVPLPASMAAGREGLQRLLARQQPIDVVVCSSDTLAQGVLTEALAQGLRVPQEMAVMGFGNLSYAAYLEPALSSVDVNSLFMGACIVEALLDRIRQGRRGKRAVRMDTGFQIIERKTT